MCLGWQQRVGNVCIIDPIRIADLVNFPLKKASIVENISKSWRHHGASCY